MITLALFTNCHKDCVENPTIFLTLESFRDTFGDIETEIYCDPQPFTRKYDDYAILIKKKTGITPIKTSGLADGWKRAIDNAKTPYVFICEADWTFKNINHSLQEIIDIMKQDRLWCMNFSKTANDNSLSGSWWQSYLKANGRYCLTDRFSNGVNILNVEMFKPYMDRVDWTLPAAGLIEQELQRCVEVAVYGEYDYPATIEHIDMRRGIMKGAKKINVFYLNDKRNNLGDNLNKVVLEWLGIPVNYVVNIDMRGKFVGVGSLMSVVRDGDTVWGTGIIRDNQNLDYIGENTKFLAVRGCKTREVLKDAGYDVPEIYGDPSMLLPLIYIPEDNLDHDTIEVGYIPHYIDKETDEVKKLRESGAYIIDIQTLDWKSFVRKIMKCKKIVSSSLHGLIIAEAYGKPVEWVKYSDNLVGGDFKFRDYLTGTKRPEQSYGDFPPLDPEVLREIQENLVRVFPSVVKNTDTTTSDKREKIA